MRTLSRQPIQPFRAAVVALVLMALAATPALGYVIFLKDGSQIIAREKYRVEGDVALFELQSGVTSSIPLAEIDAERTDRENLVALRGVQVIDGFEAVDMANAAAPPPPPDTISDLLRTTGETGGLRLPDPRRRSRTAVVEEEPASGPPRTGAGYVDLVLLPRRPYAHAEVRDNLLQYFQGQGIETLGVFEGSAAGQPFVEMLASSEAAVWKALEESANALLQVRTAHPDQVSALEVLMLARAEDKSRAGQFQLTPELAELLATGQVAPPAFFLRYVEF